ncbi:MAG: type I methionyl aminopeptidase [Phycisphaerae bacterium]
MSRPRGIILKSDREIELIRAAGSVVQRVLSKMREMALPGVTTSELNTTAEAMIAEAGGIPLFKGVENPQARFPFPAALCTSVNEELVHGIPGDRVLRDGDIVSVDCGVKLAGYCGDSATTIAVGDVAEETARLMNVTRGSLMLALGEIKPGRMWSEVAGKIQAYVEGQGFAVVRDFVGHGIGRDMHEEPKVPNYWNKSQRAVDFELTERMVLAIEPMVNAGTHRVEYGDDDRWVVVTCDRRPAAHFEHTVAVRANGVDVLTEADSDGG